MRLIQRGRCNCQIRDPYYAQLLRQLDIRLIVQLNVQLRAQLRVKFSEQLRYPLSEQLFNQLRSTA